MSPSSSACHSESSGNHSRRLFQKTIEVFDCRIDGQALGAGLRHSLGGLDGRAVAEHELRAFPSRQQSLRAATDSLEERMLPILRY